MAVENYTGATTVKGAPAVFGKVIAAAFEGFLNYRGPNLGQSKM